jgi:hypothetical protein
MKFEAFPTLHILLYFLPAINADHVNFLVFVNFVNVTLRLDKGLKRIISTIKRLDERLEKSNTLKNKMKL